MVDAHRASSAGQTGTPAPLDHIGRVPGVMGARPILCGTRITTRSVHGRVAGGDSIDDLRLDYPGIPREAFEAALAYEAGNVDAGHRP